MIPADAETPEASLPAWAGLLARARLRAYDLEDVASDLQRIEDVVPEGELRRRADLLDELRPASFRRRRGEVNGGVAHRIPVLRQFQRAREELAAISEFCDAAAAAFAELAERVAELERRIEALKNR